MEGAHQVQRLTNAILLISEIRIRVKKDFGTKIKQPRKHNLLRHEIGCKDEGPGAKQFTETAQLK